MSNSKWFLKPVLFVVAAVFLAGCEAQFDTRKSGGTQVVNTRSVFDQPDYGHSLPPPNGRTDAQRQARRSYYQGPRGSEF